MKIVVCIKQVPGTNKVEVDPVTGVLNRKDVDSKMNPYDLYAIETALRLKEAYGGSVSVISMGPPQAKAVIYEAFSLGADHGTLVSDRKFAGADVLATSYTLAQGIQKLGGFDVILCGKQTIDGDTAQVGPEISEWLDLPCVTDVRHIVSVSKQAILAEVEMDREVQILRVPFPCLLTVEKDICQPRLPSYKRKRDTRDRPIQVLSLEDLKDHDETKYGLSGSPTQVQRIFPPESNHDQELWQDTTEVLTEQLFGKLKEWKFI